MSLTMTRPSSSSLCEPRWATPRSNRKTFGHQIIAVAERLGLPLMPWQQQVALVGGELDPDTGLPAFREVVVTVPRQSGKTSLVLAWMAQRALGWNGPQKIVYSAQTGNDARKKLVDDWTPILEPRKAKVGIRRILGGIGNEKIAFDNGSQVVLLASMEESGHGKTVHLGVRDELWADFDDRRAGALIPAMLTVPSAQMLTASTAGTDASVPWNRVVEEGRKMVDAGKCSDVAYFEWSAPEGADMSDEDLWWSWMPALGHTQTPAAIRHAAASASMTEGEFRRALGNLPTRSDERLIPAGVWDLVCGPNVAPSGRVVFAVDVGEERDEAAIVAVSEGREVEVVEATASDPNRQRRLGLGWLPDRIAELSVKYGQPRLAYDLSGPVAAVVDGLEPEVKRRLRLCPLKGGDLPVACGQFYDDVAEARVRVRRDNALDVAVAGARRKFAGDRWRFVRKDSSTDITSLMAAAVGLWVAGSPAPPPRIHTLNPDAAKAPVS